MAGSMLLMLRGAGLFPKPEELDPEQTELALTTASELMLMIRDGRETSDNPKAEEYYAKLMGLDDPVN